MILVFLNLMFVFCVGDEMSDNDLLLVTLSVKLLPSYFRNCLGVTMRMGGNGNSYYGKVMGMGIRIVSDESGNGNGDDKNGNGRDWETKGIPAHL